MKDQFSEPSTTTRLAGAAVFGAIAAVTTFALQIPYPVPGFTFLVIDPAELVDVLAFLLFGPSIGFLTAIVHWGVLNFLPTAVPIFGPLLKLFAVGSMLIGMWAGHSLVKRVVPQRAGKKTVLGLMLAFGLITRVLVLTPVNYLFLIFIFAPGFAPSASFLEFYLGGLAIYNGLHTLFSTILPFLVLTYLTRAAPQLQGRTWFFRTTGSAPSRLSSST